MSYFLNQVPTKNERSLNTLVENRTSFSFDTCELSIFETHKSALNVDLVFDDFVLTSMLQGKKIMQLEGTSRFDYLPGESVIVSPGQSMKIDFPEASFENPTQCIALEISGDLIKSTMDLLNEYHPKVEKSENWIIDSKTFHLINNIQLADTINRIIRISRYDQGKSKDIIIDLTLREMLVRLMQTQAAKIFAKDYHTLSTSNPLAFTIRFIKENLDTKIDLDEVANKASMSRATFFKKFKEEFGITPSKYILNERLKRAERLLSNSKYSITQVCYYSGFENLSHFITVFKNEYGSSPGQYRALLS